MAAQETFNLLVVGSTPTGVTITYIKVSAVSENSDFINQMLVSNNQAESLIQAVSRLVEVDISMRSVDTIKFVDPDQITLAIADVIRSFSNTNSILEDFFETGELRNSAYQKQASIYLETLQSGLN